MKDRFKEQNLQKMRLSFYLLPLIGATLSLWKLSRRCGDRTEQELSRLSVTITLIWLAIYAMLWMGVDRASDIVSFRLLYTNAIVTSGYFLLCIALTIRLWQGKSMRLPSISKNIDRFERESRSPCDR
ncbi:MAG: hypothetical protein ACRC2R_00030 [Xenococcaceae cyanobacterium]